LSTKLLDDIPLGFELSDQGAENFTTLIENSGEASTTVLDNLTANSTPITINIDED
jgi:hypothetical protein